MMDKEFILDEIRRTAEENGGTPLGKSRFSAETGIRIADWCGIHWARWNEAIVEAGLAPNRLQGPSDTEEMTRQYCDLAKDLGRLPVETELKMKARRDPEFPSPNTYWNRLGSKRERLVACREFCHSHPGYEDVLQWCEQYLARVPRQTDKPTGSEIAYGSVYLIRSGRYYKIGKSNAVGRREYELGLQLPERAVLVHSIRTDDPTGIEAYWHKRFAAKRKNGEWFELTRDDITAFKRRKFM
jgi:hypothetical protein